jgi:NadR type nicotinamide-nucleotide adenylyltransferase
VTFRAGLIVGKFCPLHKGHELLIKTAQSSCNTVVVISYANPEFDHCDATNRDYWLSALFPSVRHLVVTDDVLKTRLEQGLETPYQTVPHDAEPEDTHRHFTAWVCHVVLGQTVDAVFTSEDYGDGFAKALTNYFSKHAGQTNPVTHVCVDKARSTVPISGTKVRSDPFRYRKLLSPEVYASFVKRIVIYGGESTGKTTLCEALANRLKTVWVPEYGRQLWLEKDGNLTLSDMTKIGVTQIQNENERTNDARDWLVCDTSPLTTAFYSASMFGTVANQLKSITNRHYDFTFVCAPDFDFVQDGTRQDEAFRDEQHAWYLRELNQRGIPFTLLSGDLDTRIGNVLSKVANTN